MKPFRRFGLIVCLLVSTTCFAASLETGSYGLNSVAGVPQRSLAADRVVIRFDDRLEPLARKLLPRIDALIASLE